MLEQLGGGAGLVTPENCQEKIDEMKSLADTIITDRIYEYYP